MERIASFSVDHLLLEPGVYVSRIDRDPATGAAVTTFDLRPTTPNKEPVMNTAECHTIEHLGATFLRNHAEWSSRTFTLAPWLPHGLFTWSCLVSDERGDLAAFVRELLSSPPRRMSPEAAPRSGNLPDQNLPMATGSRAATHRPADIDEKHLHYQQA